ncbi:MAG: glycerophosphodiester phosphodiesterase [Hyphomicrobiaceae bacterium]|nr:glycerophosphodiester phosphodiesterase [Hyphomicrobiaceae bacterium]MCC0023612.1 glycerophosphodiester phosphodiesterase [Hyphomicrobiaceae bacterium]
MSVLQQVLARPIAHRGLHNAGAGIIENTLPAFERAIQGGYGIECDLQMSGDGVPIVFHDETLDRLTGQSGRLSTLSAGQIDRVSIKDSAEKASPPRFAALLDLVAGKVPLVVELKHQSPGTNLAFSDAANEVAKSYAGPLVFKSFNPNILVHLHNVACRQPVGIIVEGFHAPQFRVEISAWQRFVLRHLLHYPRSRFDFISCAHDELKLPAVRLLRRMGKPVTTWTVRSPEDERKARQHADQIVFEGYLPKIG